MTLDTESEARMWKAMLDETGSDVVDAGRRWNAAQSQEETVDDIVTEYISFQTRGDTRTVKDYKALQRNHITNEIGWQPAASVEAKDLRKYVKTLLAKKLAEDHPQHLYHRLCRLQPGHPGSSHPGQSLFRSSTADVDQNRTARHRATGHRRHYERDRSELLASGANACRHWSPMV